MKRCHRCGETKPIGEFHVNRLRADRVQTYCKPCRSDYDHARYERGHGAVPRRPTGSHRFNQAWLRSLKVGRPCTDCGRAYHPAAMQWDHLPGYEKRGDVSALSSLSREEILEEIAKCELVCTNCHTMRTARRSGWSVEEEMGRYLFTHRPAA